MVWCGPGGGGVHPGISRKESLCSCTCRSDFPATCRSQHEEPLAAQGVSVDFSTEPQTPWLPLDVGTSILLCSDVGFSFIETIKSRVSQ